MLQRIQSIFLLLAAIVNLGIFLVPVWQYAEGSNTESITALSSTATVEGGTRVASFLDNPLNLVPGIVGAVASLFILVIIFQYKNRKRQISLTNLALLLLLVEIGAWVGITQMGPFQIGAGTGESTPWIGFGLPVLALILTWLGRSYIAKDEKLVRSSERFR